MTRPACCHEMQTFYDARAAHGEAAAEVRRLTQATADQADELAACREDNVRMMERVKALEEALREIRLCGYCRAWHTASRALAKPTT